MSFFQVDGLPQLTSYVNFLASGGLKKMVATEIVVPVMRQGANRIQQDAPFRTGALRRSVSFEMGGGKGVICRIRIKAGHAGLVNFGTFRMLPRPYATNGYNWILSQLRKRARR